MEQYVQELEERVQALENKIFWKIGLWEIIGFLFGIWIVKLIF